MGLARHGLRRYDNTFLENDNAILKLDILMNYYKVKN